MGEHEGGSLHVLDDVGDGERLAAARDAEQLLVAFPRLETSDELVDRFGLYARRLELRDQLEGPVQRLGQLHQVRVPVVDGRVDGRRRSETVADGHGREDTMGWFR